MLSYNEAETRERNKWQCVNTQDYAKYRTNLLPESDLSLAFQCIEPCNDVYISTEACQAKFCRVSVFVFPVFQFQVLSVISVML